MGETLFELEHAYDRDELAAIFREFAVALEAETPIELHSGERRLTIDVPADVVAELEGEHEDGRTELEFELEWDDPDGTGIRVTDAETEGGTEDAETTAVDESTSTGADETSDRVETSESPGRRSRFEVYEDRAEEWRWRLVHWNGNVIGDSGEGYASRSNAERAARGVMRNAPTARIERRDE